MMSNEQLMSNEEQAISKHTGGTLQDSIISNRKTERKLRNLAFSICLHHISETEDSSSIHV